MMAVVCFVDAFLPPKLGHFYDALFSSSSEISSSEMVEYGMVQHCGVLCSNLEKSLEFYLKVLKFTDETSKRPDTLPFRGAFLGIGKKGSQIHLMELSNPDPIDGRPPHAGRDRHIAITTPNITPIIQELALNGVEYTMSKSGRRAVFTRDPDGNGLEFIELL